MSFKLDTQDEVLSVRIEGDLTIPYLRELRESLVGELPRAGALRLDLSGVEDMDSAGFQLLFALKQKAVRYGIGMEIQSASDSVRDCMRTLGMSGVFGLSDG